MPPRRSHDRTLESEAMILGRYVSGRHVPAHLAARYAGAMRALGEPGVLSDPVGDAATARPVLLPFLDAAAGLLAPASALRRRLLVIAAVLETSPEFADLFLPQTVHPIAWIVRLAWESLTAMIKAVLGIPLFFVLRGRA